jgi:hypothetical protein
MIGEIYAPSNYDSQDQDPKRSAKEKLEIIANSAPQVVENKLLDTYKVNLPFVWGLTAEPYVHDPDVLYLHHVNVGDEELYNHGIGTRLLKAAVAHSASKNPNLKRVIAIDADLGLVNTLIKSFGEENIRVSLAPNECYGAGTKNSLEAIFDLQPPIEGEPYRVWEVEGYIDKKQIEDWELPIPTK